MTNYYLLTWKREVEVASAFSTTDNNLDHELIKKMDQKRILPFDLELKRIKESEDGLSINDNLFELKDPWLDYQPNNLAWPLMSGNLKNVIEKSLTGNEGVEWVQCSIKGGQEYKTYYVLRFANKLDVLETHKTMFVPGTDFIIKPCFSLQKVCRYSIFHLPTSDVLWKITSSLYINEDLKKAIQRQRVTGVDFEKTDVA